MWRIRRRHCFSFITCHEASLCSPHTSGLLATPLSCEEWPDTCGAHESVPGEFCAMQAPSRSKQSLRCPRFAPPCPTHLQGATTLLPACP